MNHEEYAESLTLIADWYRQHPEVPLPHDAAIFYLFSVHGKESMAVLARALGDCEKTVDEACGQYVVSCKFGAIELQARWSREEVCQRVVVGTRTVPEERVPEKIVPAHEELIYEWQCPDSILAPKGERA